MSIIASAEMGHGRGALDIGLRTLRRFTHNQVVRYEFTSLHEANITHAIFARHGGVSPAPWQSLNLSAATGDMSARIDENYRRVYAALGFTARDAVTSRQVHGASVAVVGEAQRGERLPDCDALITNRPNIVLLQRYADCVPLLVFDRVQRVVGVAHAGWRGTLVNMAGALVGAMQSAYGSRPSVACMLSSW